MTEDPERAFQTLHEILRTARNRLSLDIWDYLMGGAESETTVKRNRLALDQIAFRPRVLRDVSRIDPSTTFLGRKLSLPVTLAPIGSLESFDPDGGVTAAKASARAGVASMHSSVSTPDLETIAAAADNLKIFQLYVRGDDDWVDDFARRAIAAGYDAFCLTVDTASYSRRERDIAKRFDKPWRRRATGREFQGGLNWDHVKRFKDRHAIPLMLKGIATAEDAAIALEHGVDLIGVSNHGGRQLDHGRGTMEILPEVVQAVAGRVPIVIDGGFMRGTDVVKAIAAGADLVGLGRLPVAGLAAAGEAGMVRVWQLLEDEIRICLGLLGAVDLGQLNGSYLHPAAPVDPPGVTSAFPLLDLPPERY